MGKYDDEGELSTSQITSYQRCKRQWWLQYYRELQYSDGGNKPVTVGLIVHKAMEHYYSPEGLGTNAIEAAEKMIEDMVEAEPVYELEIRNHGALALTMIVHYFDWVGETQADAGIEITSVESRISQPLGNTGFTLTGRPDARATRFGLRLPIDHKTVDSFDMIPKTAQINHQFLTYALLEYLNDKETAMDAIMINMFRRVDSAHPDAKPPYFQRYEVRYNVQELRNHWHHVVAVAKEIAATRARLEAGEDHQKVVPPSPSRDCSWGCAFRFVCPMFDDGSNAEGFIKAQYGDGLVGIGR